MYYIVQHTIVQCFSETIFPFLFLSRPNMIRHNIQHYPIQSSYMYKTHRKIQTMFLGIAYCPSCSETIYPHILGLGVIVYLCLCRNDIFFCSIFFTHILHIVFSNLHFIYVYMGFQLLFEIKGL